MTKSDPRFIVVRDIQFTLRREAKESRMAKDAPKNDSGLLKPRIKFIAVITLLAVISVVLVRL